MATLNFSGYTFSTTSVPTSPALKVVSGTDTYYVNLTTSQRPSALTAQKVFTMSSANYNYLRPFVTSNSRTGYTGKSNNSTKTTGYSGVSNNATATTGYAGVGNNSTVTTGYTGKSNNKTTTTGYTGVSNNSTLTTGYTGVSSNITVTTGYTGKSNNSTKTTGYTGYSSSADVGVAQAYYRIWNLYQYDLNTLNSQSVSNMTNWSLWYSYSTPVDTTATYTDTNYTTFFEAGFRDDVVTYSIPWDVTCSLWFSDTSSFLNPDWLYEKTGSKSISVSWEALTEAINFPNQGGKMTFENLGYGGFSKSISVTNGTTTFSNAATQYGGPIGECHATFSIIGGEPFVRYTVSYKMTATSTAKIGIGWGYSNTKILLGQTGFKPVYNYGSVKRTGGTFTLDFTSPLSTSAGAEKMSSYSWINSKPNIEVVEFSGRTYTTTDTLPYYTNMFSASSENVYLSSSVAVTNLSSTTALTKTTTRYSSSTAVAKLSSTTALTKTTTKYSSSVSTVSNLVSTTALTVTTTRYSSSVAIGSLSSTTALTKTTTRYSSSTAIANLSSTTALTVTTTVNRSSSTTATSLSSTTALTVTTTRYSSSVAKGYLSSTTALTKTTTRYSSSTAIGNLSSTTGLSKVTSI